MQGGLRRPGAPLGVTFQTPIWAVTYPYGMTIHSRLRNLRITDCHGLMTDFSEIVGQTVMGAQAAQKALRSAGGRQMHTTMMVATSSSHGRRGRCDLPLRQHDKDPILRVRRGARGVLAQGTRRAVLLSAPTSSCLSSPSLSRVARSSTHTAFLCSARARPAR